MGVNKKIWGPLYWDFLHLATINLRFQGKIPIQQQEQLVAIFNNFNVLLPCKDCAIHYDEFLKKNPIEYSVSDRIALSKWMYDLHNTVNDRNNVKENSRPSFNQVLNKYENTKKINNCKIVLIILISIVILFIMLKLFKKFK